GVEVGVPGVLGLHVGTGNSDGGSADVVDDIVPAIHKLNANCFRLRDRHRGADAEVVVRNGPREEDGARVVPVIFGFDDFSAGRGDPFSEVEFETLGLGRLDAEVSLLNEFQLVGCVDQLVDAAVDKVNAS